MPDWQGGGNTADVAANTNVETETVVTDSSGEKDPQPLDPTGENESANNNNQPAA
jgi:hypothetical protein